MISWLAVDQLGCESSRYDFLVTFYLLSDACCPLHLLLVFISSLVAWFCNVVRVSV
jgi:hypothetical protein